MKHSNLALRHWALAALMVWVLFGCSRCRDGEGPMTDRLSSPILETTDPSATGEAPLTNRPRSTETILAEELDIVYFDFDSDMLTAPARDALEQNAQWLRENPDLPILIEGHCDERGTDEYNYNLGERRASAVYQYLLDLGVTNELATRSYGETRPAREGSGEEIWRWNRRAQFSLYAD
jgi:peptidoglycan-associated lipoprotein